MNRLLEGLVGFLAITFFGFIAWIIFLANTGADSVFFDVIKRIPYGDKLGHIGLYGLLTLLTIVACQFRRLTLAGVRIYWGVLVVAVFVVLEECSQAFIPSRTFDYGDLAANGVGILAAATAARGIAFYRRGRRL